MYIIMRGNLSEGFQPIGPFESFEDAAAYTDDGWIMEMKAPQLSSSKSRPMSDDLAHRMVSEAQNNQMIDQYYLEAGALLVEGANEITRLRAVVEELENRLFTHCAVDEFWRVWRLVGEPHIHGVYESTWLAFRAALGHGWARRNDE